MYAIYLVGSLRFSLVVLILLLGGVVWAYVDPAYQTMALLPPLTLFTVNLSAAIVAQAKFRQQVSLLVFHLSLLALIILVALSRLTYFRGAAGVVEGEEFSGQLVFRQQGPWHQDRLGTVRFVNEGFEIDYREGMQRDKTRNTVRVVEAEGHERRVIIGDQIPLEVNGYRFYTTFNKGFAPVFVWMPFSGQPMLGAVQLPSYPLNEYSQAATWTPPGSRDELWIQLQFDETIIDPAKPSRFRVPQKHKVVLRVNDRREELTVGQRIELSDGRLQYQGVRSWMGYSIFYDWTIPWLLASCVTAVASLGWYFVRKFSDKGWDRESAGDVGNVRRFGGSG